MRASEQATIEALKNRPDREKVSVIVTTYNEEVNIAGCLESVQWADEVLLVDSYSTDRTLEIAAGYDVKVLQREYFGSAAQKNWSIDRVSHDWVLIIDADERVPPPLAAEILRTLATPQQVNGFSIRRENIFIDKVVRHSGWSTDKVVRLFRRLMPTTDDYHGAAFFFKMGGRISATPLMMVLLCVEVSDVIFALDSIPAIFAITRDSFIVFTSNVFAILGLRSLYFLLAGVMDKFHYLRAGLGLVLAFVGVKMILGHTPWKIPVGPALGVVALILGASIAASLLWPPKDSRSETAA